MWSSDCQEDFLPACPLQSSKVCTTVGICAVGSPSPDAAKFWVHKISSTVETTYRSLLRDSISVGDPSRSSQLLICFPPQSLWYWGAYQRQSLICAKACWESFLAPLSIPGLNPSASSVSDVQGMTLHILYAIA